MYVKKLVDDVNNKIEIYYFFTEIETTKNVLHVTKFNFTVKNELRVYKVDDDIIILVFNINQIKSFRLERFQILMLKHTEKKVVRIG